MGDEFDPAESVQYDPETGTYRGRFDSTAVAPTVAVVRVIAYLSEEEPTTLPPLHDSVDPDALNKLCTRQMKGRQEGDCTVRFTYYGYQVHIERYGILKIESPDSDVSDKGTGLPDGQL